MIFASRRPGESTRESTVWACYQGYTYVRVGGSVAGTGFAGHNDVPYAGQSCAVPANVHITVTNTDQTS